MEVEVFAKSMQGENKGGLGVGLIRRGAEVFGETLVGEGAEALEQAAVALEIGVEHFGERQAVMAVGHRREDAGDEEGGSSQDVFLVAGGAEPAAFTRESQEVFLSAMVAAEAGEAAVEVAAVEEFMDDLRDGRAQGAEAGLVVLRVDFDEGGEVAMGALPEGRLARIAGAIGLHGWERPRRGRPMHLASSSKAIVTGTI